MSETNAAHDEGLNVAAKLAGHEPDKAPAPAPESPATIAARAVILQRMIAANTVHDPVTGEKLTGRDHIAYEQPNPITGEGGGFYDPLARRLQEAQDQQVAPLLVKAHIANQAGEAEVRDSLLTEAAEHRLFDADPIARRLATSALHAADDGLLETAKERHGAALITPGLSGLTRARIVGWGDRIATADYEAKLGSGAMPAQLVEAPAQLAPEPAPQVSESAPVAAA